MSDKKDEIQEQESEIKTTKTKTPDPWERVEVTIPRGSERGDPNLTVGMNGVNYVIPRGKKSMVPRCVAEEIRRSEQAQDLFYQNSDKLAKAAEVQPAVK